MRPRVAVPVASSSSHAAAAVAGAAATPAGRPAAARAAVVAVVAVVALALGCGGDDAPGAGGTGGGGSSGGASGSSGGSSGSSGDPSLPPTDPASGPAAGNPDGACDVPAEARAEDSSRPTTVVGTGTPASCTSAAFVAAVAKGGVVTFHCGPAPFTLVVEETARVRNDGPEGVILDGKNLVTLSGGGKTRILYQNSCSSELGGGRDCNDQERPRLVVQNLTFVDGDASGVADGDNAGGGGAIWARGGRVKIVNARFFGNRAAARGSDVAGGAVRVLDFPSKSKSPTRPVFVTHSTFGGAGVGNQAANGGAVGSIGASWQIRNSLFVENRATGEGASDGEGGNGGAIYLDGNTIALDLCGSRIEGNRANAGGSAIFFVSNDRSGTLRIADSVLTNNPKGDFETSGFPGIFVLAAPGQPVVERSTLD